MKFDFKIDLAGADNKFRRAAEEYPQAVARALNKTATTARAQAARQIRSVGYNIKINAIKKNLVIRRATRSELTAVIRASGRPIPLINYGAQQNATGVSVAVLNGRKTIRHAFIATMKSGHKGVFVRTGAAAQRIGRSAHITRGRTQHGGKHGLPIKELYGPSIPDAFANSAVQDALKQVIEQRFGVVLAAEIKFVGLGR
jgi:hypothetical protein